MSRQDWSDVLDEIDRVKALNAELQDRLGQAEVRIGTDSRLIAHIEALNAELLAALEDLLDTIPKLTDDNAMAFHKARAALAKAKGEP